LPSAGLGDLVAEHVRSSIYRETGADALTNVPGIRVHTAIEAMMWALEKFFLSILDVNTVAGSTPPGPARSPGWLPAPTTATHDNGSLLREAPFGTAPGGIRTHTRVRAAMLRTSPRIAYRSYVDSTVRRRV
jgi:hypothetical protein